ncbi:hypothetical protein GCM10010273_10590 [Streptomyces lavendulocolor]
MFMTHRWASTLAAAAGAAGLVVAGATTASATTVIGFGNSAIGNACTNLGSATADGVTAAGPGVVTALVAAVPYASATNQCGNLGIPLRPLEDRVVVQAVEA